MALTPRSGPLTEIGIPRACTPHLLFGHPDSAESMLDDAPATKLDPSRWRWNVTRPRAADDFATIRARMEELRLERERAEGAEKPIATEQIPVRVNRIGQVAIAVGRSRSAAG